MNEDAFWENIHRTAKMLFPPSPTMTALEIPYDLWVAADLFRQAGYPLQEILARLQIAAPAWEYAGMCYAELHSVSRFFWWQGGFHGVDEAPAVFLQQACGPRWPWQGSAGDFFRNELPRQIRDAVYAHPQVGPFADCGWQVGYIGQHYQHIKRRFVHNGRQVMLDGKPLWDKQGVALDGLDAASFRMLGARWMGDKERVYLHCERGNDPCYEYFAILPDANPDSFEELNLRYARDARAVYWIGGKRLPCKRPATFHIVPYSYTPLVGANAGKPQLEIWQSLIGADDAQVYSAGSLLKGANATDFHHLGGDYYTDNSHVWYQKSMLDGADPQTFIVGESPYDACDRLRAYAGKEPLGAQQAFECWEEYFDAHPELEGWWWHQEKARRLSAKDTPLTPLSEAYFTDGTQLFCRCHEKFVLLEGADRASFELMEHGFARDHHRVYFSPRNFAGECGVLAQADPASFVVLGRWWSRDRARAWYGHAKSVRIDAASFEILDEHYARDAAGLLFEGTRKKEIADPQQAVALGGGYLRCGATLYWRGKAAATGKMAVENARYLDEGLLMDANGHWLLRGQYRKPLADGASMHVLGRHFFADKSRVFYLDFFGLREVKGADPASFVVTGTATGKDARGEYRMDERD